MMRVAASDKVRAGKRADSMFLLRAKWFLQKSGYVILFVGVTALLVWWQKPERPTNQEVRQNAPPIAARTVGDAWQWNNASAPSAATPKATKQASGSSTFDVAGIHAALRNVALSESDDVVVDAKTLDALRLLKIDLDVAQIEELQGIIRSGLPGKAGEQAATIVGDYLRYRSVAKDLEAVEMPTGDLQAATTHHERLVALRQQYLGYETAEKLFGNEQAYARFMIDAMRIQASPGLSDEQKSQMISELREKLPPDLLSKRQ